MKRAFIVLLLLLCIPQVMSLEVSRLVMDSQVEGQDLVTDFSLTLTGQGGEDSFVLSIPSNTEVLSLKDNFGTVESQVTRSELRMLFRPFQANEQRTVIGTLRSTNAIADKESFHEFFFEFRSDTEEPLPLEYKLFFPEDASMIENDSIRPGFSVFDETENSLWWGVDVEGEEIFVVRYVLPEKPNYVGWTLGIIILVAVVGFGGFYGFKATKKKKRLRGVKILNEKERLVLELVIQKEGITQFELKRKTNLTKSNLSKVLARLETRALITRKKYGKINHIHPGEKLKKI